MHRQIQKESIKTPQKKSIIKKQPHVNSATKIQEKSHNQKYVLEPIITVNGQRKYKKYEKIKKIGKGTYSQVFLVQTVGSQSMYALKIIPKNKLQVLIREKLIYEIKIQQLLSHPNVVYLDHWFEDQDFQYIFMQYCPNGTLQSKLRTLTEFPQKAIKTYVKQIVQSLMYIHSKNILHRDLKMCNFYIDQNDQVKLGDFGFACQLNHSNQLKRQTCGTPNYIAPESISGFGYSFTADIWAVGVILYRMKYAICPFQGSNVKHTLQNVKLCKYVFPKTPKISSQLKDLITKIFNLNYDERPTLQQIYNHPFFDDVQQNLFTKNKKEGLTKQKRGFSLSRLFSSDKKQPKQNSKLSPKSGKKVPVRSNSCQTFKKMKQTFKQKNLNTLVSSNTMPTQQNMYVQSKTQTYITLGPLTTSRQPRQGSNNLRSLRDIVDSNTTFLSEYSSVNTKIDRNSRINQFLNKQQITNTNKVNILNIKDNGKIGQNQNAIKSINLQGDRKRVFQHMLETFQKKYLFPISYKIEKDFIIITFPQGLKMLVYSSLKSSGRESGRESAYGSGDSQHPQQSKFNIQPQVLIFYKNKFQAYNLSGEKVQIQSMSKVLKYIIDKKITNFDEGVIESQDFFNYNQSFQTILNKLPNIILQKKQGIILLYGTRIKGYLVAKSSTQQFQYLTSLEEKKLNTLFKYNSVKQKYQIEDGPILSKIYAGWTQQLLSIYNQK